VSAQLCVRCGLEPATSELLCAGCRADSPSERLWAAIERYRAATVRVRDGDPSAEAWDELVDARRALNQALSAFAEAS
jgi:hypothetical protein